MSSEDFCSNLIKCADLNPNILVIATSPPPYIENLRIRKNADNIILVFKEEKSQVSHFKVKQSFSDTSEAGESLADISVTGQPLEVPFDDEDTMNITVPLDQVVLTKDHFHAPLSMVEARKCLSVAALKMKPPLPIWILTDMSDRNKTFLLASEIKGEWRTRYWAMAHSNQIEKPPLKDMLEDFEKRFPVKNGYKINSEVSCEFNIKEDQRVLKYSKCFLKVHWQTPSYQVNMAQADTSLLIECNVGQEDSQITRWWQQLNLLHEYVEIIKQRKGTQLIQDTYQRDSIKLPSFKSKEAQDSSLASRVQELLQRSDSMSVCCQPGSEHDTTSALNSTIHELLDKQKGQDFTDRLWSLLIDADSYQELAECFQLVLKEVRKQTVKPYIFAKNKTRLACLLRSLKSGSSDIQLILEPLELMVELGLEKLKRDYMFMFLASQLTSEDSLRLPKLPSFSELGGSEWLDNVNSWLKWLAQLHTVLEIVSVVHTTMNSATLVQVASLALSTYLGNNSPVMSLQHLINNRTYHLLAPVVAKEVKSFIEGDHTFHRWNLTVSAIARTHEIHSTYVLLEDSPFPQKILLNLMDQDETLNDTGFLTETVLQASTSNLVEEKYAYIQLCSVSNKVPS